MAMFGANVDELNALAIAMDQAAVQLLTTRQSVGAKVQQTSWTGPDADRFRSDWSASNNSRLASAARLLNDAASSLRNNAAEQTQASAAAGESPGVGVTFTGPMPSGSSRFARGEAITAPELLAEEQKLLNQNIPGTPWTYNQIGGLIPGANTALDVADLANSISHGDVSVHQVVDLAAGAARGSGDPAAYVAGVAVGMGNTLWKEGEAANFNLPQLATDFSYIQQNPLDAVEAAGQAIATQFPAEIPDLVKNLLW
ncbi:MAG TPA: hypothetical protein VGN33_09430 [Leifsonia sp.]|jgi:hypothetical protein|nr:hypothetical protein [Leifsonia sp.]